MSWHADDVILDKYMENSLDPARASSVEAHLLSCESCRERVASIIPPRRREQVWGGIQREMNIPQPGPMETLLSRIGLPWYVARLLAATPSLSLSWLGALALTLGFAVVAAHQGPRGIVIFLLLAPLLPVAGVAAAYGPVIDPTYEIGLASPMSSFRVLLIRTTAVLFTTLALVGLFGLGLPGVDWTPALWLAPGLALTLSSLALATWMRPMWAAGLVSVFWVGGIALANRLSGPIQGAFQTQAQIAFIAIGLLATVILTARRRTFELRGEL